jgi:hypothetical protein
VFRSYVRSCAILFGAALASVAAVNGTVDPYGLFRVVELEGLERGRAMAFVRQARALKPLQLALRRPETVLIGTSRVLGGLNPSYLERSGRGAAYNFGLERLGLGDSRRVADLALAKSSVQRILLELSYQPPDFGHPDEGTSLPDDFGRSTALLSAPLRALLSSTALGDSARVLSARADTPAYLHDRIQPDGFRAFSVDASPGGWLHSYRAAVKTMRVLAGRRPGQVELGVGSNQALALRAYPEFRRELGALAERCRERGVELIVFTSPTHALTLEWIDAWGEWRSFEVWKAASTLTAAEHGFAFWDFASYDPVTTAPLLNAERTHHLDPIHFEEAIGNAMLARMLGIDDPDLDVPASFGRRLQPDQLDAHFRRGREAREVYRQTRPHEVAWRRSFAAEAPSQAHAARYVGFRIGGERHGEGMMRWSDGRTYIGSWRHDRPDGRGAMTRPDGVMQVGHWRAGVFVEE